MPSSEGRRSFLLGITLNELSFIMFFLLMITSAATLQSTKQQLKQVSEKKSELKAQVIEIKSSYEQTFKRLQLLENKLIQAGRLSSKPSEKELDQVFSKLQDVMNTEQVHQENIHLQKTLQSLQPYQNLIETLQKSDSKTASVQQAIEQLTEQVDVAHRQQLLLQGQVAYFQEKLAGNGLDHSPCWVDEEGEVEYLYDITLYEHTLEIKAAWPKHREAEVQKIKNAEALVGKSLNEKMLRQQVTPIFTWSQAHDCRHFVRIKDSEQTSKADFKRQMLSIEAYFYKYLQR